MGQGNRKVRMDQCMMVNGELEKGTVSEGFTIKKGFNLKAFSKKVWSMGMEKSTFKMAIFMRDNTKKINFKERVIFFII